jgi:hypothetical protein
MKNRLIFAFFAAAILFVVVREWSAPVACLRIGLSDAPAVTAREIP